MNRQDRIPAVHQVLVVPGFGDISDLPTLTALGGEDLLLSDPTSATDPDLVYSAALAISRDWAELQDHATAKVWLRKAITTFEVESHIAFNNIVLTSAHALPDLADDLAEIWEELSHDGSLLGNVAIEAWTRLALAGWSDNLPVRAALGKRAKQAAVDTVEADIFLVRSLGAAMDVWPSSETRRALERLSVVEDVECDVAFELAMDHIRQAVSVEDPIDAAGAFAAAHAMFERANFRRRTAGCRRVRRHYRRDRGVPRRPCGGCRRCRPGSTCGHGLAPRLPRASARVAPSSRRNRKFMGQRAQRPEPPHRAGRGVARRGLAPVRRRRAPREPPGHRPRGKPTYFRDHIRHDHSSSCPRTRDRPRDDRFACVVRPANRERSHANRRVSPACRAVARRDVNASDRTRPARRVRSHRRGARPHQEGTGAGKTRGLA